MTNTCWRILLCLALLGLAVGLIACAPQEYRPLRPAEAYEGATLVSANPTVWRVIDEEAGVVCYSFDYRGGISCLPIASTKLDH